MGRRLYVGNLPYSMDEYRLTQIFAEYGIALRSARVIYDRTTDVSKGFGFVDLMDEHNIDDVIARMNGVLGDGRPLRVDMATERTPGVPGGGGGGRGGHAQKNGGDQPSSHWGNAGAGGGGNGGGRKPRGGGGRRPRGNDDDGGGGGYGRNY